MAKTAKKKKTAVKRKKNTRSEERRKNLILEYRGWSAGDRCYTVFSGESKPSLCDIIHFHPTDSITPSASVMEVTTGKYRVAAICAISETAKGAKELKPKWERRLNSYRKKQKQIQKQKQETEE